MLKVSHLNAGYEDLQVLKDINLAIHPGTISVLMGPNGAGKSTLLRAIFNLAEISSGRIEFRGQDITNLPTYERLKTGMAYVPQGRVNFGMLTVEENLLLVSPEREALEKIFKEFPILREKAKDYAFQLSGGQQQLLALARALINLPKLLLLDEPSSGLSPKLVKEIFAKIREINKQFDVTILIVEHNLKSALHAADFGLVMVGGEIIAEDNAQNLKNSEVLRKVFVGKFE